ncbi:9763_t:CDS:2, partial [Funneliformis geosporum]
SIENRLIHYGSSRQSRRNAPCYLAISSGSYFATSIHKSSWPERGQEKSKFTGLPIWSNAPCLHNPPPVSKMAPASKMTTLTCVSAFVTGVASLVCIYKTIKRDKRKQDGPSLIRIYGSINEERDVNIWTLFLFDNIITAYIIATFIALIAGLVFGGVGKLRAIFGIFHNILEVFIVAALCHRTKAHYAAGILVTLVCSVFVTGTISQLPWYWDSMFFKFQGKFDPGFYSTGPLHLVDHEKTNERSLKNLRYLTIASLVHLIGNIFNVVGNDSGSSYDEYIPFVILYQLSDIRHLRALLGEIQQQLPNCQYNCFGFIFLLLWGASASAITILIGINEHLQIRYTVNTYNPQEESLKLNRLDFEKEYTIFARGQCCPKAGTNGIFELGPVDFTATETIEYRSQPCAKAMTTGTDPQGSYHNDNLNFVTEGQCVMSNNGLQTS